MCFSDPWPYKYPLFEGFLVGKLKKDVGCSVTSCGQFMHRNKINLLLSLAAQVNPPYTTADVLTTSASVNDDVFKSSNLDEEDLQVWKLYLVGNSNLFIFE